MNNGQRGTFRTIIRITTKIPKLKKKLDLPGLIDIDSDILIH